MFMQSASQPASQPCLLCANSTDHARFAADTAIPNEPFQTNQSIQSSRWRLGKSCIQHLQARLFVEEDNALGNPMIVVERHGGVHANRNLDVVDPVSRITRDELVKTNASVAIENDSARSVTLQISKGQQDHHRS